MQVVVIFNFPDCDDVSSHKADTILDILSDDIESLDYDWWIEDVIGNIND